MSPPRGSAGPVFTISTEILVASVIFLFVTVVFVVFLYLYVKHRWGHAARLRRFVVFEADPAPAATLRGLDPAVLSALPVTIYRSSDTDSATLECAVCLCHVSDGEKARLLPRCSHGFHLECIDMWFRSHSTCPLCRSPVHHHHVPTASHAVGPSEAAASLPSNVGLSWGTHHDRFGQQGASLGLLVIEIPGRQQQPGVDDDEEEIKSATSLKGWSLGKREDVEQGFATAASACASAPPHTQE